MLSPTSAKSPSPNPRSGIPSAPPTPNAPVRHGLRPPSRLGARICGRLFADECRMHKQCGNRRTLCCARCTSCYILIIVSKDAGIHDNLGCSLYDCEFYSSFSMIFNGFLLLNLKSISVLHFG
ncbi:hypothetical protein RchiOBHm_Chr7g0212721 [Rosa chinensis]|uniref:Uncharacterized protein n=1 Tax=Rosa chinensis TaxID=74649 RepID=A0A2P6PAS9_ROSCH|nr:hypothetical protein RchiOBHm_Chr7g0212721 [Rosa chinensis]